MGITIRELKEFLGRIPKEMDDFTMVNGEYGELPGEDSNEHMYYRADKPIIMLAIDDESKELIFCNQTEEEVNNIANNGAN